MFNIGKRAKLINFDKINSNEISLYHLEHMLHNGGIVNTQYSYFGPNTSKGVVSVNTKYGLLKIKFSTIGVWADKLELLEVDENYKNNKDNNKE